MIIIRVKNIVKANPFIFYPIYPNPAGTQHLEDISLWSYFNRDVPDHNRTKIGRIRFLTYFGSAMSDLHLASENKEKFP